MKLKGKKLKDEKMKHLQSHGGKIKSKWNSLRPRRGKKKKKKKCIGLAKMFVWVLHVADTVHSILQKTQTNIGQPNSDKNNLNNDLDFGKVNTISKLKIQDTP